jgi:type IV pilus assembly protein PilF
MARSLNFSTQSASIALASCLAIVSVVGLGGCAAGPGAGNSRGDLITDSDESEASKRARIRLELAVGYFDKGQTTIALDELKQSINADPGLYEAYNLRGLIYMRLNDLSLAEESFRRALSINSKAANVQHNYGWLLCQHARMPEAENLFTAALANPAYGDRAKTWMTLGLCQLKEGQKATAETSLLRSYELDAGNPITGYNLALLFYQRGEFVRSQFYVRRINNSELANAESLWLGIKVERRLNSKESSAQLAGQLKKRFAQSREAAALDRGAFDE